MSRSVESVEKVENHEARENEEFFDKFLAVHVIFILCHARRLSGIISLQSRTNFFVKTIVAQIASYSQHFFFGAFSTVSLGNWNVVTNSSIEKRPHLFLYAALFLFIWVGSRLMVRFLSLDSRLSVAMFFVSVVFVVWLASRYVAKYFHRPFSNSEQWKLVLYCSSWVFIQELLVMYAYLKQDADESSLDTGGMLLVVCVSLVFYSLVLWVGFTRLSRAFVAAYLRRHPDAVA